MNLTKKSKQRQKAIIWIGLGLVLLGLSGYHFLFGFFNAPITAADFAQCLTQKGAVMYGLDTCSSCLHQKKIFGEAFEHVNYVNCNFDQESCRVNRISRVPKWIVRGEKMEGNVQTFDRLSEVTGCVLPAAEEEPSTEDEPAVDSET